MLKVVNQNKTIYTPTDQTYTKLLLHGNNLLDYSGNAHVATANGGATVNNSGNPFGFGGVFSFDGSGDYLTVPSSTDWDFGFDDFAIDFFVYFNSSNPWTSLIYPNILGSYSSDTNRFAIFVSGISGRGMDFYVNDGTIHAVETTTQPLLDTWHHYAMVRSSGILTIYENGIAAASGDMNYDISIGERLDIARHGQDGVTAAYLDGNLAELRVLKGTDNGWTGSTIDVPTKPYALGNFN